MRRLIGGFTIVEVMIFLAVSSALFLAAVTVFQGKNGKTQFEQGMRDFVSRLQKYVDDVGTGVFPGGYNCSVSLSTGRASLSAGSNGAGTNQGCIYLGRAIQVVPTQNSIYIYSVLGNQYTQSTGEVVTSFSGAMPEPAFDNGADLTEQYDMNWAKVKSSTVASYSSGTYSSTLVGFYNSLQDGYISSGANGGQSIVAKGYKFQSNDTGTARSDAVKSCIEEQNANGLTCANTPYLKEWDVCFTSTVSNQSALLTVGSTPAGITTDLNFASC